jgi:squalene synthase HpnC
MGIVNKEYIADLTKKSGGFYGVKTLDAAYDFCRRITLGHYENFPVGSVLIPKNLRKNIYSIYAFARVADDIADEIQGDEDLRIGYLENLAGLVLRSDDFLESESDNSDFKGGKNPILWALADNLAEKDLPKEPFLRLLDAFKRDIKFVQAKGFEDLEDYCSYSANPVGEIILRIFGLFDEKTKLFSDAVCTGLQLVNFWQDLSVDLTRGRCYIPQNLLQKYELEINDLQLNEKSVNLRRCLDEIYDYTEEFLRKGRGLVNYLDNARLRTEIKATILGGQQLLKKVKYFDTKIFVYRPRHSKLDIIKILFMIIFSKWTH